MTNYPNRYAPLLTRVEAEFIRAQLTARVEGTVLGPTPTGAWSPVAACELIYKPTGERIRFTARSVYDDDYLIIADYEIATGVRGAIANFNPLTKSYYWMVQDEQDDWVGIRDLSDAELWCLRYLGEFLTVWGGLRTDT